MRRQPYLHFWIGMGLYVVLILTTTVSITQFDLGMFSYLVSILPIVPFIYAMVAITFAIRKTDELEQRVHLQSVLLAAFFTGGWTFTWGLLESADLIVHLSPIWVAPSMIGAWGISNTIVRRWYA